MPFLRAAAVTLLGQSGAAVSHTGNTDETTLATITIPANAMGANGRIEVSAFFTYPSSANVKTLRVKFGATTFKTVTPTTTTEIDVLTHITNRGATNSQVGPPLGQIIINQAASASPVTAAIDTTAAVTLLITGQLASAAETLVLESYSVRLIRA